ncbi:MAG TPA: hypothetical protein VLT16_11775 [Candidatus Limnocylindrales bacterium]|nr:hypothetical protein [Candidatus Limnocylindrales bacterium]
MRFWAYKSAAALLILCVLVICIAPNVDLPKTTLRGEQIAQLLAHCVLVLSAALALTQFLIFIFRRRESLTFPHRLHSLSLLCAFLC